MRMATPSELLIEAKTAYHSLLIGKAVVEVRDASGEYIKYSVANKSLLAAYIADLQAQVDGSSRAPMRPFL